MVYYCGMSDTPGASPVHHPAAKQIVKYRSKAKIHETVTKALDGRLQPGQIIKTSTPVKVKPGPKPNVVKDFNNDSRSLDMAIYIGQGLTLEEAGILAGFMPEELAQLNDRSDSYRSFVELQMIKFKQKHLKVIDSKDNPSTSQWMLEQKFPEQYGKKAKESSGVGSTHIIQAIVKSVQNEPDNLVVHEHENKKEAEGHDGSQLDKGNQPSLEPGGASIL